MICAWCGAVESTESYLCYIRQDWMYSEKAMELPYKALEDPEIERQKARVKMESRTGYNVYHAIYMVRRFARSTVSILSSAALTASFFALPSIPLWQKLLLVFGLALSITVSLLSTKRQLAIDRKVRSEESYVDVNVYADALGEFMEDYSGSKGHEKGLLSQSGVERPGDRRIVSTPFRRIRNHDAVRAERRNHSRFHCEVRRLYHDDDRSRHGTHDGV